jgi:hypothetical protein
MSGGVKYDKEKAPMHLLAWEALEQIAKVMGFGATKYAPGNWAKGITQSRLISAALRHVYQYNSGEDKDPESGLSHLAHAACCINMAIWNEMKRPDLDDRWIKEISKD